MTRLELHNNDCLEVLKSLDSDSLDSLVTDPPAGISFMGKDWDGNKGGRDAWVKWLTEILQECYRVLKPGAHGLVWALPRTSHWTATALEDAGFEVRDVVTHLFGSGFPKSLDVSKAIDKSAGATREVLATLPAGSGPLKTGHVNKSGGGMSIGTERSPELKITAPATDEAKQWQGWGTALKPAAEHWILVRKPLGEKTVAANVLKHGTGALNIDASRVATADVIATTVNNDIRGGRLCEGEQRNPASTYQQSLLGRFPANLVLSHNDDCDDTCTTECAVAALDAQSGVSKSQVRKVKPGERMRASTNHGANEFNRVEGGVNDLGGASRFFYVAKASRKDKGVGNSHPTPKSTTLMEYLIRLVTPPGGVVLDPFAGSGSTGVAAKRLGFGFVGVEREQEYFEVAQNRLEEAS
jgi:hypothetical protein